MSRDDAKEKIVKEIAVSDFLLALRSATAYLKSQWIIILVVTLTCAVLAGVYSHYKKTTYTAVCTFVLDDQSSGFGQYAGLAALAGINIGGSSSGVFRGDNILSLYISRLMIEKTLLSSANFDGKNQMLIDRYLIFNKIRKKWATDKALATITFTGNPEQFDRTQDSVITDLWNNFTLKDLNVAKPDKKLNIIRVEFSSKDELFAKNFTDQLVKNVNDFYVQTKTKKELQTLEIFQHEADSVKGILNSSLTSVASANESVPNANPLLQTLQVPSQKRQVQVQSNSAIYAEVVKNLEVSKVALRQELPLIQVIDKPVLPLMNNRGSRFKSVIVGAFLGFFGTIIFLFIRKVYRLISRPD